MDCQRILHGFKNHISSNPTQPHSPSFHSYIHAQKYANIQTHTHTVTHSHQNTQACLSLHQFLCLLYSTTSGTRCPRQPLPHLETMATSQTKTCKKSSEAARGPRAKRQNDTFGPINCWPSGCTLARFLPRPCRRRDGLRSVQIHAAEHSTHRYTSPRCFACG